MKEEAEEEEEEEKETKYFPQKKNQPELLLLLLLLLSFSIVCDQLLDYYYSGRAQVSINSRIIILFCLLRV